MTAALTLTGVTVPGRLHDVTFTVASGAVHGLVGPNGAGKSTVLECALGLTAFTGTLALATSGARPLAVVPQRLQHDVVLPLTVLELFAASRTQWPVCLGVSSSIRRRTRAALERVQLPGFERRRLAELSGGERKRVLLADALDHAPGLLLLDEPDAGLDAASSTWLEAALKERSATGLTTLLISHDAARVERLAAHVTRLEAGRCV